MELEALHPLIGDPCRLPFHWGVVHLRFFHGLHDSIDGGGAEDDWNPSREWTGVIQNKEDLLFVIMGHSLHLDPG